MLAGVSVDYYAQLERGDLSRASEEVLDAVGRALQLDEAEMTHLLDLAHAAEHQHDHLGAGVSGARDAAAVEAQVRPSLQRFLDLNHAVPMWVRDERMDLIAANDLGRALNAPVFTADPHRTPNAARFVFAHEGEARQFYPDWDHVASDVVTTLALYLGRRAGDEALGALIEELLSVSDAFRKLWSRHDISFHQIGSKKIHHPVVGDLELTYEAFDLPNNPDWHMFAFTADADSPSAERLRRLAAWCVSRAAEVGPSLQESGPHLARTAGAPLRPL